MPSNLNLGAHDFVGEIVFTARSVAPAGFLKCNGAAISRTVYADLFAAIGTTYGAGDGSTTFNVPETRGEFLRCLDDGRSVDTGRVLGSAQGATEISNFVQSDTGGVSGISLRTANADGTGANTGRTDYLSAASQTVVGSQYGISFKVRPRNVAFLACIRY